MCYSQTKQKLLQSEIKSLPRSKTAMMVKICHDLSFAPGSMMMQQAPMRQSQKFAHGRFAAASLLMSAAVPVPPSWPSDPNDTIS